MLLQKMKEIQIFCCNIIFKKLGTGARDVQESCATAVTTKKYLIFNIKQVAFVLFFNIIRF